MHVFLIPPAMAPAMELSSPDCAAAADAPVIANPGEAQLAQKLAARVSTTVPLNPHPACMPLSAAQGAALASAPGKDHMSLSVSSDVSSVVAPTKFRMDAEIPKCSRWCAQARAGLDARGWSAVGGDASPDGGQPGPGPGSRAGGGGGGDASPPRRRRPRHDSPDAGAGGGGDASPPRRRARHDTPDGDASPPRRRCRPLAVKADGISFCQCGITALKCDALHVL